MPISLSKGGNVSLTKQAPGLTDIVVGLGWDARSTTGDAFDLDASALVCGTTGKVRSGADFIFYNQASSADGTVVHAGDNLTGQGEGDDEQLTLDLSRVYAKVDTIVLLVSSYQGHSLEWVANAYCRLVGEDDVELVRYTLTAGPAETGVVMATLVRTGDAWTLRAVGEGIAARIPTDAFDALRAFL